MTVDIILNKKSSEITGRLPSIKFTCICSIGNTGTKNWTCVLNLFASINNLFPLKIKKR